MQNIEAILPLKIHARTDASDLDRFSTLLLPSFDRFFCSKEGLTISLVVPEEDFSKVTKHIQKLRRSDVQVVCEDEVCPNLKGQSGWYKQQILKLAAARLVSSEYYLVLDADIILKRSTSLQDLFPSGKPILQKTEARTHWDWWVASQRILKSKVDLDQESIVIDVTPEFLHRATCLALQGAIASRNNAEKWDQFLFDSRQAGWTEYSLYWLYVLEQGLDQQLYDWSSMNMYSGIWESNMLSQSHLREIFTPGSDTFFVVVQSNLNLKLSSIRKLILPYLEQDNIHSDRHSNAFPKNQIVER